MQTWRGGRRRRRPSSSEQASMASIWYLWLASFLVGPQRFWLVLPREEDNDDDKKRIAASCSPPSPPPTSSSPSPSPTMAMAAIASQQHLVSCCRIQTWPLAKHMKLRRSYVVSCSSSLSSDSPPSETKVDSAGACVNLGLSLFSKGRVIKHSTQWNDIFLFFGKVCIFVKHVLEFVIIYRY